ncbi:hypothetical protein H4Q26_003043 [Puccinia striiformis f. sp. tritici PST-130]|nr:hypothetical protein H4Q26_003043 [Puccinia striiformis f. sp. tritici PST-130]
MPSTSTPKPPSPARLSSIATSLLTSILELTQQNSLELSVDPQTKTKIIKNLVSLRDGLIQTNGTINEQDQILVGLRNQYQRIIALLNGSAGMKSDIEDEFDHDLDFTSNRLSRTNRKMDNLFRKIAKDGACWTIFGLVAILLRSEQMYIHATGEMAGTIGLKQEADTPTKLHLVL